MRGRADWPGPVAGVSCVGTLRSREGGNAQLEPVRLVAGGVVREMAARLTAIEIAADRLARLIEGGEGGAEVRTILEQSRGLAELARTLLALALPDRPNRRAVDLHKLLEEVSDAARSEMEGAGILVLLDSRAGLTAWGDPHQIRGAVLALLANARKALESWPRDRTVVLSAGRSDDDRPFIRVADSGPGIPEGEEERILVPFVSGWGRAGMGLALSRLALLQQGGDLVVEPAKELGGGAAFTLLLGISEPERPERPEGAGDGK